MSFHSPQPRARQADPQLAVRLPGARLGCLRGHRHTHIPPRAREQKGPIDRALALSPACNPSPLARLLSAQPSLRAMLDADQRCRSGSSWEGERGSGGHGPGGEPPLVTLTVPEVPTCSGRGRGGGGAGPASRDSHRCSLGAVVLCHGGAGTACSCRATACWGPAASPQPGLLLEHHFRSAWSPQASLRDSRRRTRGQWAGP